MGALIPTTTQRSCTWITIQTPTHTLTPRLSRIRSCTLTEKRTTYLSTSSSQSSRFSTGYHHPCRYAPTSKKQRLTIAIWWSKKVKRWPTSNTTKLQETIPQSKASHQSKTITHLSCLKVAIQGIVRRMKLWETCWLVKKLSFPRRLHGAKIVLRQMSWTKPCFAKTTD